MSIHTSSPVVAGSSLDRQESYLYPPLESVTSPTVVTEYAAHYMNRRPQTLRVWACKQNGPIKPIRINGRLAWPVSQLRALLGVA